MGRYFTLTFKCERKLSLYALKNPIEEKKIKKVNIILIKFDIMGKNVLKKEGAGRFTNVV